MCSKRPSADCGPFLSSGDGGICSDLRDTRDHFPTNVGSLVDLVNHHCHFPPGLQLSGPMRLGQSMRCSYYFKPTVRGEGFWGNPGGMVRFLEACVCDLKQGGEERGHI